VFNKKKFAVRLSWRTSRGTGDARLHARTQMPFGKKAKPKTEGGSAWCACVSSRGIILSTDIRCDPLEEWHVCSFGDHWNGDGMPTWKGGASKGIQAFAFGEGTGTTLYQSNTVSFGEPVVYLPTHAVPSFVDLVLPRIRRRFRLVTGDCDLAIPAPLVAKHCRTLLECEHLVAWFAQNCVEPGGKLHQVSVSRTAAAPHARDTYAPSRLTWSRSHLCRCP
jgi:hypothetical protein